MFCKTFPEHFWVHSDEGEHQPHNHKVQSLIPWSRCQLRDCSLAHTFRPSRNVVARKAKKSVSNYSLFIQPQRMTKIYHVTMLCLKIN